MIYKEIYFSSTFISMCNPGRPAHLSTPKAPYFVSISAFFRRHLFVTFEFPFLSSGFLLVKRLHGFANISSFIDQYYE